jgi:alpha-tubulin suppressor-like RCC1 family protein
LVRAVEVSGVEDAIQVAVGSRYSCAVTADARTVCWGWTPPFGEIRPRPDKDVTPRTIDELNGASELALRGDWGCAVITAQGGKKQHSSAGRVRCWGLAHSGRLGHTQPKAGAYVDGLMDAVHVAIGSAHACAIRRDRSVVCWGNPRNGGLGRSDVREDGDPRALAVDARFDASELALGSSVACARTAASILCWGSEPFEEGTHLLAPQSLPIR